MERIINELETIELCSMIERVAKRNYDFESFTEPFIKRMLFLFDLCDTDNRMRVETLTYPIDSQYIYNEMCYLLGLE